MQAAIPPLGLQGARCAVHSLPSSLTNISLLNLPCLLQPSSHILPSKTTAAEPKIVSPFTSSFVSCTQLSPSAEDHTSLLIMNILFRWITKLLPSLFPKGIL